MILDLYFNNQFFLRTSPSSVCMWCIKLHRNFVPSPTRLRETRPDSSPRYQDRSRRCRRRANIGDGYFPSFPALTIRSANIFSPYKLLVGIGINRNHNREFDAIVWNLNRISNSIILYRTFMRSLTPWREPYSQYDRK